MARVRFIDPGIIVQSGGGGGEGPSSISTGSLLTTASISGDNLIFTKGNESTFSLTLPSVVIGGGIFSQTGSFYATTNDLQVSGSLKVSGSYGLIGTPPTYPLTLQTVGGGIQTVGTLFIDADSKAGTTARIMLGTSNTNADIARLTDNSLVIGGEAQYYGWRIFGIKHGANGGLNKFTTEIDNLIATGSMKVSGSLDISLQSGSAFTITEKDIDQENRLTFKYDQGNPTLEIASRFSTGSFQLKQGQTGTGLFLDSLGKIKYITGGLTYGVALTTTGFNPIIGNQINLGAYNRRWKNVYINNGDKISFGVNASSNIDLVSFRHTVGTNTLVMSGSSDVTLDVKGNITTKQIGITSSAGIGFGFPGGGNETSDVNIFTDVPGEINFFQSGVKAMGINSLGVPSVGEGNIVITDSFNLSGSALRTASFGHFVGDGSGLTGIDTGSWDGQFSGSAGITGSLTVSGSLEVQSGTSRMYFESGSSVGSNDGKILIKSTGGPSNISLWRTDGAQSALLTGASGTGFYFSNTGYFGIQPTLNPAVQTSFGGASAFYMDGATGKVGINTNNPLNRFYVAGIIGTNSDIIATGSIYGTTGSFKHIIVGENSTTDGNIVFETSAGPTFKIGVSGSGADNSFTISGTTGALEQTVTLDSEIQGLSLIDGGYINIAQGVTTGSKKGGGVHVRTQGNISSNGRLGIFSTDTTGPYIGNSSYGGAGTHGTFRIINGLSSDNDADSGSFTIAEFGDDIKFNTPVSASKFTVSSSSDSEPGYTFWNNPNTGMLSTGTTNLKFQINGGSSPELELTTSQATFRIPVSLNNNELVNPSRIRALGSITGSNFELPISGNLMVDGDTKITGSLVVSGSVDGIYSPNQIKAQNIIKVGEKAFFRDSPAILHLGLGTSTCAAISTERDCIHFRVNSLDGFGSDIPFKIHEDFIYAREHLTGSSITLSGSLLYIPENLASVDHNASPFTITDQQFILINPSGGDVQINLPDATTYPGREIKLKLTEDSGADTVTLQCQGVDTIDGVANNTTALEDQYEAISIVSDGGTGWFIF